LVPVNTSDICRMEVLVTDNVQKITETPLRLLNSTIPVPVTETKRTTVWVWVERLGSSTSVWMTSLSWSIVQVLQ
jgi:hypothetical protein